MYQFPLSECELDTEEKIQHYLKNWQQKEIHFQEDDKIEIVPKVEQHEILLKNENSDKEQVNSAQEHIHQK